MKVLKRVMMVLFIIGLTIRAITVAQILVEIIRDERHDRKQDKLFRDKQWRARFLAKAANLQRRDLQITTMAERFWLETESSDADENDGLEETLQARADLVLYFHLFVDLLDLEDALREVSKKAPIEYLLGLEGKAELQRELLHDQSQKLERVHDIDTSNIREWMKQAIPAELSPEFAPYIRP